MVVMVIGALISGFNKGVSDMLEQSGPKTFWVGRHFQGGVSICDDTDENCPWRRNPAMKVEDARLIRQVASVAFVAVDEVRPLPHLIGEINHPRVLTLLIDHVQRVRPHTILIVGVEITDPAEPLIDRGVNERPARWG